MNKLKIIGLTAVCTFFITLFLSLFTPDLISKITEDSLVNNPEISQLFNGMEIEDVTYLGNRTYMIIANNKKFIARKEYYSFMNYKWNIFEKIIEWG